MINLTIQSANNKVIEAIDLGNNSLVSTFNSSEPVNLAYANYKFDIQTASTLTFDNFGHVVNPHNYPDFLPFVIIFGMFILMMIVMAVMFRRKHK